MNASLTTIKEQYDLTTESGLIRLAQDAGRDFKFKMMLVVEYWCKPVQQGGQGRKIEDLASKINKSAKTLRNHYVAPLRKEGRLPEATQGNRSRTKCPSTGTSVENVSTKVHPESSPVLSPEVITDDQLPTSIQRCNTMGRGPDSVSAIQSTMGAYSQGPDETAIQMDPNDPATYLARDWHTVQESNASDSFKRAHELLCEFELLLGQSDKDGWSPAEFYQLATTLDSYHRSCSNCSAEYREELRQYGAARCASIERTLEGDSDAR